MAISTVKAKINGQTYTLTYNAASGKYEATITAPTHSSFNVNAGHYYPVEIEAKDVAGNVTTVNDQTPTIGAKCKLLVKEKVKPVITIKSPGSSARLTTNKPSITFEVRDNDSGININTLALKINNGASIANTSSGMSVTAVAGGYNCTYTPTQTLGDGSNTITVDVNDNDGNIGNRASVSFIVDTVAPTLNITSPSNGLITNVENLNVIGITSDATSSPVTVNIKLNNVDQGIVSLDGSGNFSKAIKLSSGVNTILIRATDGAGKVTEVTRAVTLDKIPPTITNIEMIPNPLDAGATFIVKVTAND